VRKLFLLLALLVCTNRAFAQSTTVSGQVTDAGGQTWNNAAVTAQFVPNPLYPTLPQYTWTGGALNPTLSGTANATGGYSISIPSNTSITPVGSFWQFKFCPQASSPCFLTANVSITGGTQTVNATPPAIFVTPGVGATAYADSEITGAVIGSTYYSTTTNSPRVCNGPSTPCTWAAGGGTTSSSSIPGSPGVTAVPVQSGLMAEYRILPTETPATLVDYSGNSNTAVGTADTAPTIIAVSGGMNCAGAGAVKLPAAVNSAKTIQIFLSFQDSGNSQVYNSPIAGNGLAATSGFFTFRTVNNAAGVSLPAVWRTYTNSSVRAISYSTFNGTGLVSVVMGASLDALYYNGSNVTDAPNTVSTSSGGQTTGQFQLCGVSAAVNIGVPAYMFGNIYYAVFYNRVLSATEIAANAAYISQSMAARGITTSFSSTPATDELSALGDSLTLGGPPSTFWPTMIVGNLVGANWLAQDWAQGNQLAAQGASLSGAASTTGNNAGLASMFHPAANRNLFAMWAGTNDFALQSDTATHIAA
jgi:hypothetical protein